ncbi:MAG TPA: hypothetical protein VJ892_01740 [Candidatus Absconditabacterales bacterium]|nr:hypothetical protein [Candidatus Absconditabacterales bacterium]
MKNKKLILTLLFGFVFVGFGFAQVNLNPIYGSERFQPSDKFHAGCDNQVDVVFDLENGNIDLINAILQYDNKNIEILKIVPEGEQENKLTYSLEENKIVFNKLKSENLGLDRVLFKIFFKTKSDIEKTNFNFMEGSYLVDGSGNSIDIKKDFSFEFAKVPECEPDIISPSIDLIFPVLTTGEYVALDSYFTFEMSDQGKGLNKNSIAIIIDDIKYDISNIEHEWSGNFLTVYPDIWLPLGSDVKLEIQVADKQVYGKANLTHKDYFFKTSTGLYLLNDIDPVQFRKLVNKEKYYKGSLEECELINKYYNLEDDAGKEILMSINKRLSCPELMDSGELIMDNETEEDDVGYSVFAVLGWVMFGLLFAIRFFSWLSKPHKHEEETDNG